MVTFKEKYKGAKEKLLLDPLICEENKQIFEEFFEWEEYKLQRENDLRELDESCFKTLYLYTTRLRIVNRWFRNRPWKDLTRDDIQEVYDDVEDGRIVTLRGRPFKSADSYYGRIMKGKPFELAGKADLSREIIRFTKKRKPVVRFLTQEGFLNLVSVLNRPRYLMLFWLAWDIGENIGTLLQLQKKDFTRGTDPHSGEPEYLVNLPAPKLKRSRQTRSEPTLYPETVRYCDMVLSSLSNQEKVFPFDHRRALYLLRSVAQMTGVTCDPDGKRVRWKDLRSGMACHLLSVGWQPHEINLRLGHTPNSNTLNAYINHLAVNRRRPKHRHHDSEVERLREELRKSKEREKASRARALNGKFEEDIRGENDFLRAELAQTKARVEELGVMVRKLVRKLSI